MKKPSNATHWSERTTAAQVEIAPSSVHKIGEHMASSRTW